MKSIGSWLLAATAAFAGAQPLQAEDLAIDLKLFGQHEIPGGLSDCHLALWQHDRDPETDKFAYLFYMPFAGDGAPMEALIEIGKERLSLTEKARGDVDPETRLGHRLYASANDATHVIIQIQEVSETSSIAKIDRARVTVIQEDFRPFIVTTKGVLGCPGSAAAPAADIAASDVSASAYGGPRGLPFRPRQDLAEASEVPIAVRAEMAAYAADQCDLTGEKAYAGARYQLSDAFILWEVPCFLGAYQGSSAFAITQDPPQDWAVLLSFPNPPALEGNNNLAAMNPDVMPEQGLVISKDYGRGPGDCGTYQVFRLMDAPGETFEFQLMEYREKLECDGEQSSPETWPLQFAAE